MKPGRAAGTSPVGTEQHAVQDDLTVEDQRFAIVPEWIIDAPLSDAAFRLYAVLLRYGQASGHRMPSRATLARRLHKRSVDSVDRAMKELVALGAVVVERRHDGGRNLTNRYHVRTSTSGRSHAANSTTSPTPVAAGTRSTPTAAATPGREAAATPSRTDTAIPGRTAAADPAALVRPDPEHLTESTSSSLAGLAEACAQLRRDAGRPATRWSAACLQAALSRAQERGWPPEAAEGALLAVAADPDSRSPMRLAEAGPWWDQGPTAGPPPGLDLDGLEALLDELDGGRVRLQREARRQLSDEGAPLTRATVVRRAVDIHRREAAAGALSPAS